MPDPLKPYTPESEASGDSDGLKAANSRLQTQITQLRENEAALRQRAEHLDSLNRIGRSLSTLRDLRSALMETLKEIQSLVPLDVFFVALCDYETRQITFPLLLDTGKFYENETWSLDDESWTTDVIRTGKPFLRSYTQEEIDEIARQSDTLFGTNQVPASVVMAPLQIHDEVIGVLALQSYQPNIYNENHLALIVGASHQVAIAIENSRLYEELLSSQAATQRQADQLKALNKIGRTLANLKDIRGALLVTLDQIHSILPLDTFFIALYDPKTNLVSFPLLYDSGKYYENESRPLTGGTHTDNVIRSRQPILINRTAEEIETMTNIRIGDTSRPSGSIMMAPLMVGESVIGVVSLQSYQPNTYNEESLELLIGASHQIGIAIENARLYEALQLELMERKRAEEKVRSFNAELEERVRQRTAELEVINQELESFTYTVSHDLRAPIRGINGFSTILVNEYESQLPDEAKTYLQRIATNAHQMGKLIDDLLAFSRLGRQAIRHDVINTESLVHSIGGKLAEDAPNKNLRIEIKSLPKVYGDESLLTQVFINIISNAIKFSSKREMPAIEIGSFRKSNETIFYVKDNGAGFNMAHAGNLFGVFKRLHHFDEFEGTGVGLAIVHRILQKHGGRIWAEAEVDKGATFYFTLEPVE